jgi:hypothetical protein
MTKRQTMFFATTADVISVLSALEIAESPQYTRAGLFNTNRPQNYLSYVDIPDFGRTTHPNAVGNPTYLLSGQIVQIKVRDVPQKSGGVLFAIDQLENPDSIVLCPGGWYGNDVILYGMMGTVSQSAESKRLYMLAAKIFHKHFTKQQEFLVGPEARQMWNAGVRLTIGASSPSEFDLKRDYGDTH